jgi:microcystin-dependent protein
MARLHPNACSGVLNANLLIAGTSMSSPGLADLPAVTGPDTCDVTLDPDSVAGKPEVVTVTAHTASATTATITRATQTGDGLSAARAHNSGIKWVAAFTKADVAGATPVASAPGDTASTGTSGIAADANHRHARESFGVVGSMQPEALGSTASAGVATSPARIDHVHAMPTTAEVRDAVLPPGIIAPFAGATAPGGWLVADGSAQSRTTFAALFAIVGTTFGAGDGSTTFNLPDLRGRVPVGLDAGQVEFDTRGEVGGAKTHTLSSGEIPAHTHTVDPPSTGTSTDGSHQHSSPDGGNFVTTIVSNNAGLSVAAGGNAASSLTAAAGSHNHSVDIPSFSSGSTGSGAAHNNLQPYMALKYIIKT